MIPNFIIVGAGRSGTTSLYHYLRQHPQVCMSAIKETNFFSYLALQAETECNIQPNAYKWPVTSWEQYQSLFKRNADGTFKAFGEASPSYLYTPGVARQIKLRLPHARLIFVLRNPVDRAYSVFLKNIREGLETRSFDEVIANELEQPHQIIQNTTTCLRAGRYFQRLTEYLEYFERSQLWVGFYEDLECDSVQFLCRIFSHIGVDEDFRADTSVRFNKAMPSPIKKNRVRRQIKSFTSRIREWLPQKLYYSLLRFQYKVNEGVASYPPLSMKTRLFLRDHFAEDINNLQTLLDRDLSHWLAVE